MNRIALAIASIGAAFCIGGALQRGWAQEPVLLAQQMKAPGTVETRFLRSVPPSISARPRSPQAVLKEECTWTNSGVAQCLVWDCGDDDVCVELGQYCVDRYGHSKPC